MEINVPYTYEVVTRRKNSKLFKDENGFIYRKNTQTAKRIQIFCREKKAQGCPAVGTIKLEEEELIITKNHDHPAEVEEDPIAAEDATSVQTHFNEINPWQVDSIQAFSCLKCPECEFYNKEEKYFQEHATENHPKSIVFFGKYEVHTDLELEEKDIHDLYDHNDDIFENESNPLQSPNIVEKEFDTGDFF